MDRAAMLEAFNSVVTVHDARSLRESLSSREQEQVETTVTELFNLLGKAHAMEILSLFAFADRPLRFSEIESALEIAANTLSVRLQEFVAAGLLSRTKYDEVPPRVEYRPTPKSEALFPVFGYVHIWAIEHELDASKDGEKTY